MIENLLKQFKDNKLVVIARKVPFEKIVPVAKAIYEGGLRLLEVTFDQGRDDNIIETQKCLYALNNEMGNKILIGAGTVLNTNQVRAAHEAGAKYIVSPNTNVEVIIETKRLGMLSIPGAMTPSEISAAWNAGADMVKLFPADALGYNYIKSILMPLCHIPLMATGGVNPETIPIFYSAGITVFGTGITIIKPDLVQKCNYMEITKLAQLHFNVIRNL